MKKTLMRKYARLIARVGANICENQPVLLNAAVDQEVFVEILVDECYRAGASYVRVDWTSQAIGKLHYLHQTTETLSTVLPWEEEQLKQMTVDFPCRIYILSEDPAGMKDVDSEKMQKIRQARHPIIKKYRDAVESKVQWCIAAVPGKDWAKKVFPDLSTVKAVEKLWRCILTTCHVEDDNDPVEAWRQHNEHFRARCRRLNECRFEKLHYKSTNGTDFRVELMPESRWCGGSEKTIAGVEYNPNMPTEEIFTTPMQGRCEGKLVSTKPLSYQGQMIDRFSIEFENGAAVRWQAEIGQSVLDRILSMDDGARRLGEVALVGANSPINKMGIIFYETLFDENASCHVALGSGYNDCVENYQALTDAQCKALGVNESMIHVDFMIGADDLCIIGEKEGRFTPIFVNGEWAF